MAKATKKAAPAAKKIEEAVKAAAPVVETKATEVKAEAPKAEAPKAEKKPAAKKPAAKKAAPAKAEAKAEAPKAEAAPKAEKKTVAKKPAAKKAAPKAAAKATAAKAPAKKATPKKKELTVADVAAKLAKKLDSKKAKSIDGKVAVDIKLYGAFEAHMYIEVKDKKLTVAPYDYIENDLVAAIAVENALAIIDGKLTIAEALADGRLYAAGNIGAAAKLAQLF